MAISITSSLIPVLPAVGAAAPARRRRRIDPRSGHALEILGHAIDYLSDEYIHEGGLFSAHDPRIEAIQLLMARNREIYFACPELPSLFDRLRTWLRGH